jgi:hypothetical protein
MAQNHYIIAGTMCWKGVGLFTASNKEVQNYQYTLNNSLFFKFNLALGTHFQILVVFI